MLSDAQSRWIESIGLFVEKLGPSRIAGRMVGLFLLAPEPLTLDAIATALQISKASASTNTRFLEMVGHIESVTFPGDRRTYYRFNPETWARRFALLHTVSAAVDAFARQGEALAEDETAHAQLAEARRFAQVLGGMATDGEARWRAGGREG